MKKINNIIMSIKTLCLLAAINVSTLYLIPGDDKNSKLRVLLLKLYNFIADAIETGAAATGEAALELYRKVIKPQFIRLLRFLWIVLKELWQKFLPVWRETLYPPLRANCLWAAPRLKPIFEFVEHWIYRYEVWRRNPSEQQAWKREWEELPWRTKLQWLKFRIAFAKWRHATYEDWMWEPRILAKFLRWVTSPVVPPLRWLYRHLCLALRLIRNFIGRCIRWVFYQLYRVTVFFLLKLPFLLLKWTAIYTLRTIAWTITVGPFWLVRPERLADIYLVLFSLGTYYTVRFAYICCDKGMVWYDLIRWFYHQQALFAVFHGQFERVLIVGFIFLMPAILGYFIIGFKLRLKVPEVNLLAFFLVCLSYFCIWFCIRYHIEINRPMMQLFAVPSSMATFLNLRNLYITYLEDEVLPGNNLFEKCVMVVIIWLALAGLLCYWVLGYYVFVRFMVAPPVIPPHPGPMPPDLIALLTRK